MKIHLYFIVFFLSVVAVAGEKPQFGDIIRNTDGTVRLFHQSEAIAYCANQGGHLPSARELAQLSVSMGSKGISETPMSGYHIVHARNVNTDVSQKVDDFYFSNNGYKRPKGDFRNNVFWSSDGSASFTIPSLSTYILHGWNGDVFLLGGSYGPIEEQNTAATICVQSHGSR